MEVEFYKTAAGREVFVEFLEPLPAKSIAKIFRDIELLSEYAPNLHEPYTKHIKGSLWELRSKFSSNNYRIFYYIHKNNKLVLLHGFTKKTQKTPSSEIELAQNRLSDYEKRYN